MKLEKMQFIDGTHFDKKTIGCNLEMGEGRTLHIFADGVCAPFQVSFSPFFWHHMLKDGSFS